MPDGCIIVFGLLNKVIQTSIKEYDFYVRILHRLLPDSFMLESIKIRRF